MDTSCPDGQISVVIISMLLVIQPVVMAVIAQLTCVQSREAAEAYPALGRMNWGQVLLAVDLRLH